jgi:hypothetical protein
VPPRRGVQTLPKATMPMSPLLQSLYHALLALMGEWVWLGCCHLVARTRNMCVKMAV